MRLTIFEIQRHQWESIFLAICNHQVASSKPAVGTRIQQETKKTYRLRLAGLFCWALNIFHFALVYNPLSQMQKPTAG
jgi:hypothetical protein